MSYDLLIFDWDGTLMDSHARIVSCLRSAVIEVGLPTRKDDELRDIIGLGLEEAMARLFPGLALAQQEALVARYRDHFLHISDVVETLFEGVVETLTEMGDRGCLLAVATGKSRAGLDRGLRQTGLGDVFQMTRCADESYSKPHPQMLEDILHALATRPQRALMIGDTEFDLEMARNAGTASVGVTYGAHPPDRLNRHRPIACIDDIRELPDVLARTTLPDDFRNSDVR